MRGLTVIKEVVGTSELLEHLQPTTQGDTLGHLRSLKHAREFLDSVALDLRLGSELALNLLELDVNAVVVLGSAVNSAKSVFGALNVAHAVVITRSLGEGKNANAEDDGPEPTKTDDDAPGA